ncbi:hypothetical protein [Ferrovibrio xuzhouensis]|uniref:Uncharacterized protein n=1 Tax=Ferrovibrio xuzhouensis TaxID=1576914 RepID=A0ABV7VBF7_9PROT
MVFDPIGGPAFEPLTAAMARGSLASGALKPLIDRTFPFEQIVVTL